MGATKRAAELIFQSYASFCSTLSNTNSPCFSIVRFGNVLGSSGSVVPRFRSQIASGGPVTITHPDIVRYFMTITEAAQLVIQAQVLASTGDLFLLDMGDPVLIRDLAKQMITLSGSTLRTESNPSGDIEIVYTGLRPGEKLFEELLIDAQAEPSSHPLIFRAQESFIAPEILWPILQDLEEQVNHNNVSSCLQLLKQIVPEWTISSHLTI